MAWCLIWWFASLEKYGHTWHWMSFLTPGVIKQHKHPWFICLSPALLIIVFSIISLVSMLHLCYAWTDINLGHQVLPAPVIIVIISYHMCLLIQLLLLIHLQLYVIRISPHYSEQTHLAHTKNIHKFTSFKCCLFYNQSRISLNPTDFQ